MNTTLPVPLPRDVASAAALRDAKLLVRQWLGAAHDPRSAASMLADDVAWHASHPVNELHGRNAVLSQWIEPIAAAFSLGASHVERRLDIFMGGYFDGRFCGGEGVWVSVTGHYVGSFSTPLWGIAPHGRPATLRFGEFYRVANGKIAEARLLVDLVDLLRQTGVRVLPLSNGAELTVPGPSDHSGLMFDPQSPDIGDRTQAQVLAMFRGLFDFDGVDLNSMGMERFWSPNMMWFGPCGIGTGRGVAGFQKHHQRDFLHAFPDRRGGFHRARLSEGRYMASTGWPSVLATHTGSYLGVAATGKPISMRVMDWWRCSEGWIEENWVLIDLPELLLQMGVDVLARRRPG